jgi:hypothetical protein
MTKSRPDLQILQMYSDGLRKAMISTAVKRSKRPV